MHALRVILDADGCWPDLPEKDEAGLLINAMSGEDEAQIALALLPHGTQEGRPSVTIRLDLPDGRTILAQTTLRLFTSAARAFAAKAGMP
jgi:hypothetical protein